MEPASGGRYPQRRRVSLGAPGSGGAGPRLLSGVSFLITGFADALEDKRRSIALISEHGGEVLADLPPHSKVQLHGASSHYYPYLISSSEVCIMARCIFLVQQHVVEEARDGEAAVMVLSDRPVRTPKYLYGLACGCPIVKPSWLQVRCVKAYRTFEFLRRRGH